MSDKNYTGADIDVLTEREHVRKRTAVYLGNTQLATYMIPDFTKDKFELFESEFVPAVYTAIGEIVDNSIDEFEQIKQKNKVLKIDANPAAGSYVVSDNGRGVPIDIHKTGIHTPTVVFGSLRSGRNFSDNRAKGVKGMNGVGSAVTNYVSSKFEVVINRDNKEFHQLFTNGAQELTTPIVKSKKQTATGTKVGFTLDSEVFDKTSIDDLVILNRVIGWAFCNPDIKVVYNGNTIQYPKGLGGILNDRFERVHEFEIDVDQVKGSIFVVLTDSDDDAQVHTWVNSSYLLDGGLCNAQIINAFVSQVQSKLQSAAKRKKCTVTPNVVKSGVLVFSNLKITDPEYNGQAKLGLTGPNLRKEFADLFEQGMTKFSRVNAEWMNSVLTRAAESHRSAADKTAAKEHEERIRKSVRIEGLIDATSKDRSECRLLVTEGDSSRVTIEQARDPKTTGAIALTGKFNNVYGTTVAQLLKMGKIADLLAAIGLVPGKKAVRSELRYGKVIVAVDADYDGQDIFCNFVNLIYQFWPELLDPKQPPFVHKLIVPNVVVEKGKERIHFKNRHEYEAVSSKYKGWEVEYMKGLGAMHLKDWELVLSSNEYEVPVVSDENMKSVLELLFGNDSDKRKEWLESDEPDFDTTVQVDANGNYIPVSSDYVKQLRKEYALYVLSTKAMPMLSDGLIKGARRNLWKARSGKRFKTETLAGLTMSLHPHSETSGTINGLTAFYSNNIPLFTGFGAFGTMLTPNAYGAARYTSVEISEFTKDVIFRDLDIIPMVENYDSTEMEPAHFLPLVPVALINPTEGMGVGYSTKILPRKLEDLIQCQLDHLQGKKRTKHSLVPTSVPIDSESCSSYPTPKGETFVFRGSVEKLNSSEVRITALPYGLNRDTLKNAIDKLYQTGEIVSYVDNSAKSLDIVVRFGRGKIKDLSEEDLISKLSVIGLESEILRVLDFNGSQVLVETPENLVKKFTDWRLTWYVKRYQKLIDDESKVHSRLSDIKLAIDNNASTVAATSNNATEFKEFLERIGIVDVAYISELPIHRFTKSEYQITCDKLADSAKKLASYQEMIDDDSKRKNLYIAELKEVLSNHKKGKYKAQIN